MKKRIALIGGSGFVGKHLWKTLSDTAEVTNYDINCHVADLATIAVDIRNKEALAHALQPADWVVLLAAEHREDVTPVSRYYDMNVAGAVNVLAAMDRQGISNILFVSSVAVYGLHQANADENAPPHPFNDYGKSKWQAEEKMREWYFQNPAGRRLLIVRPAVIFGPGNKGNVHELMLQVKSGKFVMVGSGNNRKSMAYIENVTQFFKHLILRDSNGYEVFNYADKPDFSMNELVAFISQSLHQQMPALKIPYTAGYVCGVLLDWLSVLTGKKYAVSALRIQKFCASSQFAANRMLQTGFTPMFTLQQGLLKTIEQLNTE